MKNSEKTMEKIVSLCKGRGFIFSGSEIYGGLANTWDYGPLGVELKNNVKKAWWKKFVQENPYNVGLDAAILMNPQVWVASGHVGGLSGAFIPVSEDEGMIAAALDGTLTIDKLEAMTCVCSVGLDMIAVPGDTTADTISAIIADEAAIGMVNSKTTAVRIIPVEGKTVGDMVEMGGLLGSAPVMPVHSASSADFIARGGRIPAPLQSLKN